VKPGHLFVAVPGTKADGLSFVPQALVRAPQPSWRHGAPSAFPTTSHSCARRRAARTGDRGGAFPCAPAGNDRGGDRHQRQDFGCGVHAADLGSARPRGGEHRTIGLVTPKQEVYGSLTTPDPIELARTLDRLAEDGITHLAMERPRTGSISIASTACG
jgi:UDP-N-acetylmuramoyl-L-alanyl-D-glutamate--2,6-diaminopimelate ligase